LTLHQKLLTRVKIIIIIKEDLYSRAKSVKKYNFKIVCCNQAVDDFIFQKQQSANEKKTANGKSAKKASANSNQQIF
jgi:hypothetical protein